MLVWPQLWFPWLFASFWSLEYVSMECHSTALLIVIRSSCTSTSSCSACAIPRSAWKWHIHNLHQGRKSTISPNSWVTFYFDSNHSRSLTILISQWCPLTRALQIYGVTSVIITLPHIITLPRTRYTHQVPLAGGLFWMIQWAPLSSGLRSTCTYISVSREVPTVSLPNIRQDGC